MGARDYDPTTGRYGWAVMTLVRLGGLLTVAAVLGFVVMMRRREGRARLDTDHAQLRERALHARGR